MKRAVLLFVSMLISLNVYSAEFLVRRTGDVKGLTNTGDIIQIYNDGSCKEQPSPDSIYYIIKSPNYEFKSYLTNALSEIDKNTGNVNSVKEKAFSFLINSLPQENKDELSKTYWTTISAENIEQYIVNKFYGMTIK